MQFPLSLTYDDVCLVPQYSNIASRTEPDLSTWLTSDIKMKIPILAANMNTVIDDQLADILISNGSVPIFHRFTDFETQVKWAVKYIKEQNKTVCFSTGLLDKVIDSNLYKLINEYGVRLVCIDVAHGHSKRMMDMVQELKRVFQHENLQIICGNGCTSNFYIDMCNCGANSVKIGIGAGAACTTRIQTGFGSGMFSSVYECSEQAKKYRIPIIADGGISTSGDIVKALSAGASSVMIGKLFALTDESAAKKRDNNGTIEVRYKGQASEEFQNEFYGGLKDKTTAEGTAFWATSIGSSQKLINELTGGIRSGFTYGGAKTLKELQRKAEFRMVLGSYMTESKPRPN